MPFGKEKKKIRSGSIHTPALRIPVGTHSAYSSQPNSPWVQGLLQMGFGGKNFAICFDILLI